MADWNDYFGRLSESTTNDLIRRIQYIKQICKIHLDDINYQIVTIELDVLEKKLSGLYQ